MTRSNRESRLSRWSRRKLEAQQAAEVATTAPTAPPQDGVGVPSASEADAGTPVVAEAETEQPLLTDADMPDIDSLDEDSDFSPFMSAGVSDELRNLALRKLFRAPVFNIRDGLDEYDDDFTSFEKLGGIVTSDMKHRIEMEQQKLRERLAEQEAAPNAAAGDQVEMTQYEDETDEIEEIDDSGDTPALVADDAQAQTESKQDT